MKLNYFEELKKDVRFSDGIHACINCGTCTAICPAAEFYNYDPRLIADTVQRRNNDEIEKLLRSDTIWYCGECLSCKTRCPKNNTPGYIIQSLRHLSHITGLFAESEKGRQSLALKRTIGKEILESGYCMHIDRILPEMHPEQGPIWDWMRQHPNEVYARCGGNYHGEGAGAMRKIPEQDLKELSEIFEVTGGNQFYETIEYYSKIKAEELRLSFDETNECDYFKHVFSTDNNEHNR